VILFRETGVGHRITVLLIFFFTYVLFIRLILDIIVLYIQLKNYVISRKITQSLPCTPISHQLLVRNYLPTLLDC